MNKSEVMYSYSQAMRQAELLEETAHRLEALAEKRIENISESLKNGWNGENAQKYFCKLDKVKYDIAVDAKNMRLLADKIRYIAQNNIGKSHIIGD